jgi:hypothetical protein
MVVQAQPGQDLLHGFVVAACRCPAWPVRAVPALPDPGLVQQAAQIVFHAGAARGHRAHHGQAQFTRERIGVDGQAAGFGQVGHVQHHHGRQAQAAHGQHQLEVAPQVGGVHHADHQVGPLLAAGPAVEHVGVTRSSGLRGCRL